ncbi:MAG: hypothetical protein KIPDCIKN_04368 [Haliscomenobacter sp.]|nr:hypothetical protein [Haliscomenobacter sp.]
MKYHFSFPNYLDSGDCADEILKHLLSPSKAFASVLGRLHYFEVRASSMKRGGAFHSRDDIADALVARCEEYSIVPCVRVGVLGRTEGDDPKFKRDLEVMVPLVDRIDRAGIDVCLVAESLLSGVSDDDRETGEFSKGSSPEKRAACFVNAVKLFREQFGYAPQTIAGDTSLAKWRDGRHYNFQEDSAVVADAFRKEKLKLGGFLEAINETEMNPDQIKIAANHLGTHKITLGVIPTNEGDNPMEYRQRLIEQCKTLAGLGVDMLGLSVWDDEKRRLGVPTITDHIYNAAEVMKLFP